MYANDVFLIEFMAWKNRTQRETSTNWFGCRSNPTVDGKRVYYRCNRSGCPRVLNEELIADQSAKDLGEVVQSTDLETQENVKTAKKKDRERDNKGVISVKTYTVCSSFLNLKISNGKYLATFCTGHSTHDIEPEFLKIPETIKVDIASKLLAGVTVKSILKTIREDTESTYSQLKLITRKDIENIIAKDCINQDYKLDADDANSVHKFVEKDDGKNVILYKPCGETDGRYPELKAPDFALGIMSKTQQNVLVKAVNSPTSIICADATHGTTKYNFKLVTFLVVNSFGNGVPCAFLFTNREDEHVLSYFLDSIKKRTGNLEPKKFMTDDAAAYWNAFQSTMNCEKTQHLLCTWHVDKNWRKNLMKIADVEERAKIYKQLCLLRTETEETKFEIMMTNFIQRILSKDHTSEFGEYFKSHYSTRAQCWANCYRHYSFINTNMYLESMHKVLKYCVFEKKSIRRLDHAIHLVTILFGQIFGKYERMLVKPCSTKNTSQIFNLHQESKQQINHFTVERGLSPDQLIVKEKSSGNSFEINLNFPGKHECNLVCKTCKFCIDTFICSCRKNKSKGQFCIHLHLISTKPDLLPIFEQPECRFFKYLDQMKSNKAKLEQKKASFLKFLTVANQGSKVDNNETCGEIDQTVSHDGEMTSNFADQMDILDDGYTWSYDDQVHDDCLAEQVKGAALLENVAPLVNESSNDTISSVSISPIMCPLDAFDLEFKYGFQVWEQMKKEARQNPENFQKVLNSIPQLKTNLVEFISKMLPLLNETSCLKNHQNQFKAMNVSKQRASFNSNPKKAGRKRLKTSMYMPTTPEKKTYEERLMDSNLTPVKKSKETSNGKTGKNRKNTNIQSKKINNTKSQQQKNQKISAIKSQPNNKAVNAKSQSKKKPKETDPPF